MRKCHGVAFLVLTLVPLACNQSQPKRSPPATASAEPVVTQAPRPASPPATDLDVAALQKEASCVGAKGTKGAKEACRVLAEFAESGAWTGDTPAGDGRWMGYSYVVENGVERQELMVLRAQRMPTAQVGSGDLPLKVSTGPVPNDVKPYAFKLLRAMADGDVPRKGNQAMAYLRDFSTPKDRGVGRTTGVSVRLISEDTIFLRQKTLHKMILVQTPTGAGAAPGDGTYAELWLAVW